ncbi:RNA methyltransferase [Ravibacter arvi]|uniref:RNA methyltransferase n=1 Tax=Ravibacter arvi TaxID=2051041 RepID=A0ABP8M2U5_9BACT
MKKLSLDSLNRLTVEDYREAKKFPLVVILDNIRSMNNVGAFFRTCDAFRIEKLFLCGYTPLPPHREITKSALGAENAVDWEHAERTQDLVAQLKQEGYQVLAIEQAEKSTPLHQFQWTGEDRLAIVFGNEVSGVDDDVMELADGCLEIPQYGTKHSLNVSVTGGIVLWQLVSGNLMKR